MNDITARRKILAHALAECEAQISGRIVDVLRALGVDVKGPYPVSTSSREIIDACVDFCAGIEELRVIANALRRRLKEEDK